MYKNLVILPVFALIIALTGCETPKNNAAIDWECIRDQFNIKEALIIKL